MPTKYYTTDATLAANSGVDIDNATAEIIISPINPVTNLHTGYFIEAKNFIIGNGEESNGSGAAATGTNIYQNVSGDGWNVDAGISKVAFTNIGNAGDINNTVKATVTFSDGTAATVPTADAAYHIDIDESTTYPITNVFPRQVCFNVRIPYHPLFSHEFYLPNNDNTTWVVAGNPALGVTRTLIGSTPTQIGEFYTYRFEGTITDYDPVTFYTLCRVLFVRTNPSNGVSIDPLPGAGDPNSEYDHFFIAPNSYVDVSGALSNPYYDQAYNVDVTQDTNILSTLPVGVTTAVWFDIQVNPLDFAWALEEEQSGSLCLMGHQINLNVIAIDLPNVEEDSDPVIRSVSVPAFRSSHSGYSKIIVRGTPGATYNLNLIKTQSTNSIVPATSNAHYNFGVQRSFQSTPPTKTYTIGANGRTSHPFLLPPQTAETRYDVYVTPSGTTTALDGVPTKMGDKSITQTGIHTVTITPTAAADKFDLTGAAASTSIKKRASAVSSYDHLTTVGVCAATISSKTRLVLEETNPNISEGMYVTIPMSGSGIPHETKVTRVDDNIITLSAASTITIGDVIRFDENTSVIYPFTLTIPAAGTLGSELIASDPADNRTFDNDTGNWAAHDPSGGSAVAISRDASSSRLFVNVTSDSAIEGARLAIAHVGDGTTTSVVTGQVYRISMDLEGVKAIPDMRIGLGGGVSAAFAVHEAATHTVEVTTVNNTDGLLVYSESSQQDFYVDNVSVKRIQYKNLGVVSESSATYFPNRTLGGSTGLEIVEVSSVSSTTDYVLKAGDIGKCSVGNVIQGSRTRHNGNPYVPITAVVIDTNTITVASAQDISARETLTVFEDPDLETPITSSGVDLFHIHAAVTTDGGSADSQEIATVYGYIECSSPLTGSATLPLYIENLLTSASY